MDTLTQEIDWGVELRSAHQLVTEGSRRIRLPDTRKITFAGTHEQVCITVHEGGLASNMQTDGAAFEAWALALMAWCDVKVIALKWDAPSSAEGYKHYERFLFRVNFFKMLFPQRVTVRSTEAILTSRCLNAEDLQMNVAGNRQIDPPPTINSNSETWLEWQLVKSPFFKKEFNLELVDRQFPVGLFVGKPAKGAGEVFTGGKSAIDLIGIDKAGTLCLFELKKRDNASLGILSELLFYSAVMREAQANFKFKFSSQKIGHGVVIGPDEIRASKRIKACLLADPLHPLLDQADQKILRLLNDASEEQSLGVHFCTASPYAILRIK